MVGWTGWGIGLGGFWLLVGMSVVWVVRGGSCVWVFWGGWGLFFWVWVFWVSGGGVFCKWRCVCGLSGVWCSAWWWVWCSLFAGSGAIGGCIGVGLRRVGCFVGRWGGICVWVVLGFCGVFRLGRC